MNIPRFVSYLVVLGVLGCGCSPSPDVTGLRTATAQTAIAASWTRTPTHTATHTPTSTGTFTPTAAPTRTRPPRRTARPTQTPTPLPPLCGLNIVMTDPVDENLPGYTDILEASSKFEGETLVATFRLREYPAALDINFGRNGNLQYAWRAGVDVDRDQDTGVEFLNGAEFILQIYHMQRGRGGPTTVSITEGFEINVWRATSRRNLRSGNPGKLTVDADHALVTISGPIPGLNPEAAIYYDSFSANAQGQRFRDVVDCRAE